MATIKDIEYLVKRFSEKYRHPDLPEINQSPIYSLKCQLETKIKADLFWPDTWPNCEKRGVYAIFSEDELLYIGKASLQNLGSRLSCYFIYSKDRLSGIPKKEHIWSKTPTNIVTWAVPDGCFFEASALEEFLIFNLKHELPDNVLGANT